NGVGVHVERVDAVEVEGDRDRRDVRGEFDDVGARNARSERVLGDLFVVERTVGASELCAATAERVATRTRTVGAVVDVDGLMGGLEASNPGFLGRALCRRANADEGATEGRGVGAIRFGAGGFCRT